MTQLLNLPLVTADADNSLPTDGPAGPGRVLIGDLISTGVTLQGAVDNGEDVTLEASDPQITLTGSERTDEVITITQTDPVTAVIASFASTHASGHVIISGGAEEELKLYEDQIVTSAGRLDLGAGDVARVAIEDDQLLVPTGTAALPGVAGDSASGTGIRPATAVLGLSVGGSEYAQITSDGVLTKDRLGFVDDDDTYIANDTDVVTVTAGGTERARITADGVLSASRLGWTGDADTYLTAISNTISLTSGGAVRAKVTASGVMPGTDLADDLGTSSTRFGEVWQGTKRVVSENTASLSAATEVTAADTSTSDATPKNLWFFNVPENQAIIVEATVIGAQSGAAKSHYAATRIASLGVSDDGTVTFATQAEPYSHNLATAQIDITNPSGRVIAVTVTGIAATTIKWTATIRYQIVEAP